MMKVRLKNEVLARELARANRSLNSWALYLRLRSGHLSQLVNGQRKYPSPKTRQKLLEGLDLDFDALFQVEVTGGEQKA